MSSRYPLPLLLAAALVVTLASPATAAGHREAPLASLDPAADGTDLYAFRVAGDRICLIADFVPMQFPQSGPTFHGFDDNVLYELKVCNNGDAIPELTYQFRFTTTVTNGNSAFYANGQIDNLTDADWNVKQTYSLTLVRPGQSNTVLGTGLPCPPVNLGPRSLPSYATLANSTVQTLSSHGNAKVFAGQREEPYFADNGALFDLLGLRTLANPPTLGTDGFAVANTHSICLEAPITLLTAGGASTGIIGVWSTASRASVTIRRDRAPRFSITRGAWVQVSRSGNPLFNDIFVPLKDKDKFNGSNPRDDAQFLPYVNDPEPARAYTLIHGLQVPATPRADLVGAYLTGISGLNQPSGVRQAEMLRLNVATPITPSPNRLGYAGGDSQGYPNGRRLTDDVVDIQLQLVGGVLLPTFTATPNGKALSDGVNLNDSNAGAFQSTFPYLLNPVAGLR